MKFAAKLKQLEKRSGLGQRCAFCRLVLRDTGGQKAKPGDEALSVTCKDCGTRYTSHLTGTAHEREAQRLMHRYADEDFYTDAKAHAVSLWFINRPTVLAEYEQRRKQQGAKQKLSKGARLHQELSDALAKQGKRKCDRLMAKYGSRFPEQDEWAAQMQSYGLFFARKSAVEARGALETVIWGAPLPETIEELACLEREAQEKAEAEARKKAAAEAERERRNQELLERNRRAVAESQNSQNRAATSPHRDWWA